MEMAGVYMVFLALWDKLSKHDDDARARGWNGPGALTEVTSGGTVGPFFYDNGYALEATCLGEVFEVLNIAQPADYRRRSLSVGDVVVDPSGATWVCQPCGWGRLEPKNEWDPRGDFARATSNFAGDLRAACKDRNVRMETELG